ncbi:MAG: hypothetical protein A3B91_03150 [Candidatus Yanofskybacteria bacterium RIFCSPHIGHO2_02_FULL_41_29]|uniref:Uncharacterized protein n=1 Tax=Candidatus Yanofskybacteria bacterium RIFCSPHIGHO2_01_FULL_41_53 TaxID=1802663 RepID=A0A1F8EKA6_9BACT|nr:MAG: hypothetical protein A2650_02365 [Candidatus Yanofskybacteria bacterium RIFCSPHIGHO2_01_FULL_41_53]OGN10661.1 MAG: hypothetical protein A3B91_03150 [Candidatus Yanofskybacteria bacterium RIFCSPHIGHO2_02_FULL_41_29]OGN18109.1 MAG: hypothetical protein A3F48_02165 [Candidatus Yanofskybacteria bacterium RIFCSPHIGHO2_12_FULL_41_9]OGN23843.1 MAG: hypothetical protein A2916_04540 [Candidatus Yanofskybacteria bacterium RIFCSPLOWO2_01_FULL_41_67]OGN30460.1 MAG: hypothetical protein A3H54_00320 
MVKNFKRIKVELFYLKHLIERGYGPRYWWPYFKNRFFGNYLFSRLPCFDYVPDPDFELHTICSRHGQGLWMFAWMLRSFLFHSKLKPVVVIHDDGTIDKATEKLILSKFPNVKVMFRDETTKRILEMPGIPEIIKKSRLECHFFFDKLTNIIVFSKAKKVIASDSDILYYKEPTEVVDFISGKTDYDAMVQRHIGDELDFFLQMDDFYTQKYNLKENKAALLNGGYIVINKDKFTVSQFSEYLEHTKRPLNDYFIEMEGWTCLFAQVNYKFLSTERYAIKGFLGDNMVMKHYTSPRRHEMFAYGIDMARKRINESR